MKKVGKICIIVFIVLIVLGVLFYTVDLIRVRNQQKPIFCVPLVTYEDGGTKEYFGLGYKVIEYHALYSPTSIGQVEYYNKIEIGSYFMKYNAPNPVDIEISSFLGTIIDFDKNNNGIFVEPDKNEEIRNSSDNIYIPIENLDTTWKLGTRVKITFQGGVLETYPASLSKTISVEVVGSKIGQMYETVLKDLMEQDKALNYEMQYIALDLESFVRPVSEDEKNNFSKNQKSLVINQQIQDNLIQYCKQFHTDVKKASFEDLKKAGLYHEDRHSIDGILIAIDNVKEISENKAIITIMKYRSGRGAVIPTYELTYKYGGWDFKILSTAMS